MTETTNSDVVISVDLKKNRIRMYKSMLHLLEHPKYIQLLVNPQKKQVAIRGLDTTTHNDQSERIKPYKFMTGDSYELYSQDFVHKLCKVAGELEKNCSYRLYGTIISSERAALFSMDTLTRIES